MTDGLREALDPLPDEAMVPVGWIRERLQRAVARRETLQTGQQYSTGQAAKVLDVTAATAATWAADGRFPNAWKTGPSGDGEWRIPEADLFQVANGSHRGSENRHHFDKPTGG